MDKDKIVMLVQIAIGALVIPVASLLAKLMVKLVKLSSWKEDDELLLKLADELRAELVKADIPPSEE